MSTQLCQIFCAKGLVSLCLFIYFWVEKYPWENILQNIYFNKIFSLMFSLSRLPWLLWSLLSIFYNFQELSPFSYFCKAFDGLVGIDLSSEQWQLLLHVVIGDKWRSLVADLYSLCPTVSTHLTEHLGVCHTKNIAIHGNPHTCNCRSLGYYSGLSCPVCDIHYFWNKPGTEWGLKHVSYSINGRWNVDLA